MRKAILIVLSAQCYTPPLWPRENLNQSVLIAMAVWSMPHYTACHMHCPAWFKTQWVIETLEDHTRQSIIKMSELVKDFLLLFLFLQILVLSTFDLSKIGFYLEPPWKLTAYWWVCFHALEPRYLNNPGLKCRKILLQQWYIVSRCKVHSLSSCIFIFYFHNFFSVYSRISSPILLLQQHSYYCA